MEPLAFFAETLQFMAEPWFAVLWYSIGALGVLWVFYDSKTANSALNPPLKLAWPIIVFFFSVVGIALYWVTSRPLDIAKYEGKAKMERFTEYSKSIWRKTVASAIHCVGGDGFGIMTGMVIARAFKFSFWHEFWFEYLVGYLIGWFVFQTWAMALHGNSPVMAVLKGGRAEFFSMITVMAGMGLVMRFVTPSVVASQPAPDTLAFWTFGALGLIVGFILTIPMNMWMVAIGWKHGQGHEYMLKKMAEKEEEEKAQKQQHERPLARPTPHPRERERASDRVS